MIYEIYKINGYGKPEFQPIGRYTGNLYDIVKYLENQHCVSAFYVKECVVKDIKNENYKLESDIVIEFSDSHLLHKCTGDLNKRREEGVIKICYPSSNVAKINNISDETILKGIKEKLNIEEINVINKLIKKAKNATS